MAAVFLKDYVFVVWDFNVVANQDVKKRIR